MRRFLNKHEIISYLKYTPTIHHLSICYQPVETGIEYRKGEGGQFLCYVMDSDDKVTKVSIVEGFVYNVLCFLHYAQEPVDQTIIDFIEKITLNTQVL